MIDDWIKSRKSTYPIWIKDIISLDLLNEISKYLPLLHGNNKYEYMRSNTSVCMHMDRSLILSTEDCMMNNMHTFRYLYSCIPVTVLFRTEDSDIFDTPELSASTSQKIKTALFDRSPELTLGVFTQNSQKAYYNRFRKNKDNIILLGFDHGNGTNGLVILDKYRRILNKILIANSILPIPTIAQLVNFGHISKNIYDKICKYKIYEKYADLYAIIHKIRANNITLSSDTKNKLDVRMNIFIRIFDYYINKCANMQPMTYINYNKLSNDITQINPYDRFMDYLDAYSCYDIISDYKLHTLKNLVRCYK